MKAPLSLVGMVEHLAATFLVTAVLAMAGCSMQGGDKQPEPELGPISQVRIYEDIVLPLDSYLMTPDEQATLQRAARVLMLECARRFGFEPLAAMSEPSSVFTREHHVDRRYGLIRVDHAQQFGYRRPPHLRLPDDKAGGGWSPSDEEFIVVRGKDRFNGESKHGAVINGQPVLEDGCTGEAWRQIYKGSSAGANQSEGIVNNAHKLAENDSRVVAVFRAWSECMRKAGYEYSSPWDPNNHQWPDPVSPQEIVTAVADTTCKQEVNLPGIWLAVETAYQKRAIEEHAQQLNEIKRSTQVQLRNAAGALGR